MTSSQKEPGGGNDRATGSHYRNTKYLKNFSYQKLIAQFLPKEPLVLFDIGARFGESTNWFASNFKLGHVELFEPNPFLEVKLMTPKRYSFNFNRFGLSDACSVRDLNVHEDAGMTSFEKLNYKSQDTISYIDNAKIKTVPVETRRLDCLELRKPDIVKIDVQAHEESVLNGGIKLLSSASVVLIEVTLYDLYANHTTIGTIESLLPNHVLYSIPHISQNSKNLRTDWVEMFLIRKDIAKL
jgi:FkbM family methyltransferase